MQLDVQYRLSQDELAHTFLREHSYWYKYLNRNGESIKELERVMKDRYKLRTEDKLESINNSIGLIHSFMDVLK